MSLKYSVDIGSLLSGRTVELDCHTPQNAYEQIQETLNRDKFERIIQIRGTENNVVYYTDRDQQGLFPIFKRNR